MQHKNSKMDSLIVGYGDRIKLLRKVWGLNQKELAESMGLTTAVAVSKYESEKREPDFQGLSNLASRYLVSVDWLLLGFINRKLCKGFKEHSTKKGYDSAFLAKKLGVREEFIDAFFTCELFPSGVFFENARALLFGEISSDLPPPMEKEIIILRAKLEQCQKDLADFRSEYSTRINFVLSQCESHLKKVNS